LARVRVALLADRQPLPLHGRRRLPRAPACRQGVDGLEHLVGSRVVHHVADPRHVAEGAHQQLAMQARGVRIGIDDAVVRAGN